MIAPVILHRPVSLVNLQFNLNIKVDFKSYFRRSYTVSNITKCFVLCTSRYLLYITWRREAARGCAPEHVRARSRACAGQARRARRLRSPNGVTVIHIWKERDTMISDKQNLS